MMNGMQELSMEAATMNQEDPASADVLAAPAPDGGDGPEQLVAILKAETDRLRQELDIARRGPQRRRLPDTRSSVTHRFMIGENKGFITVGLYDDGQPGEVFLTVAKEGSTIGGLMDTIGILTSMALQFGVPVETLARKFEFARFEPSGRTGNPDIRAAGSMVDYVFRWLGMQFSEEYRKDRAPDRVPGDSC
jgi:ribonucleoside-diphosphate reductase alpha chain